GDPGIPLASVPVLSGGTNSCRRRSRMSSGEASPRSRRREAAPLLSLPPEVPRYAVEARFAWCADSNATPPPIMWRKLLCSRKTATEKASEFHRSNPADDQDADNFRNDSID